MKHLIAVMALAGVLMVFTPPAFAQNHYPLEILRPLPVGPAGTGLHANNRIYRAYQGIPYSIIATAIGGRWPYTFSLSSAPTGMTIDAGPCATVGTSCTAGTISWPDPQATDSSITVQICDADNRCVNATWGITVSTTIGAGGFCFINADTGNDTTGNGSPATPWRTLSKAVSSCGINSILYLRGATNTYQTNGMLNQVGSECGRGTGNGSAWVEDRLSPVIWLAYPGERPIVDEGYPSKSVCIELAGDNIWVDGLTIRNCGNECLQLHKARYGATIVRNTFDTFGPGVAGDNPGAIMYAQNYGSGGVPNTQSVHEVVARNIFSNGVVLYASALRLYSWLKGTVEFNTMVNLVTNEAIAIKSDISQITVRGNVFSGITGSAIGGNNHQVQDQTYGEMYYNNIKSATSYGIFINQDSQAGVWYIYRNTVQAPVSVRELDTSDGPFYFTNNIFVNGGGSGGSCPTRLTCEGVTAYNRIVMSGNLQGAPSDGIVDANGLLQGTYRSSWIGLRGFEPSANTGSGGADLSPPAAPQNVRLF